MSTQPYSPEDRAPVVVARREGCGHRGEGGCNGVSTWELVLVLRMKSGVLLCLVRPQQEKRRVPDIIFNTWSQAEKDKYHAERNEHNRQKPRGGSGGRGNRGGSQLAVLSNRMDELSRSISQLRSHGDGSSSTSRSSHRRSDGGTRQARRSPSRSRSRDRRDSE